MPLHVSPASESDASRIAAIHMAAFGTNAMLLAQFPSPTVRESLQTCIASKALADIGDPKTAVLVVRDDEIDDEIVSFAKWSLPVAEGDSYMESPWLWPEGTDWKVLDRWTGLVESAKEGVVGKGACYRLTFIGTDPRHERRGAASLLLQWGLERCVRDNVLAYLESTVDAGPLYERHGFASAENISMVLEGKEGESVLYEEVCFIFRPGAVPFTMDPRIQSAI
ncbi:MAG: hypothetical protein ASARMPREDX12_008937 [Alectoria sarmentosa]|nr:MAG: hypothetical protein ASARMPREDX12_008937 [Alectoria sarmentosa]